MTKLVIGVDISKSTLDCCLLRWGDKKGIHKAFLNKDLGFKQILKWLKEQLNESENILVCMEHTGYYGVKFCQFLQQHAIDYAAVNPLQIKHSMGFRREKTDKADALAIAQYALRTQDDLFLNDSLSNELLSLQVLVNYRKQLQKIELGLKHRNGNINHCLPKEYTTLIGEQTTNLHQQIRKQYKDIEKQINLFIKSKPALLQTYNLLISVPGVGPVIAWYCMIHTQNFQKIKEPRKFACYCCAAPFKKQSGTSVRGATRVSSFGNRFVKSILYLGAMNARISDPEMRQYYDKKMAEKANHRLVMNALINKLIHRIFATVKRGTPYVIRQVF